MKTLEVSHRICILLLESRLAIRQGNGKLSLVHIPVCRIFSRAKVWNIGYLYEEFNIFGIFILM